MLELVKERVDLVRETSASNYRFDIDQLLPADEL